MYVNIYSNENGIMKNKFVFGIFQNTLLKGDFVVNYIIILHLVNQYT